MDQSPRTPYRRRSSAFDVSYTSSHKPGPPSHSRTTSSGSIPSSIAPRPLSYGGVDGFGATNGFGNLSNGLHNLADELAGMEEEESGGIGSGTGRQPAYCNGEESLQQAHWNNVEEISLDSQTGSGGLCLSPGNKRHGRERRSKYDRSDSGDDSDLDEAPWISPSLAAEMAAVEALARRDTELNGSDADKIAKRVADSLKDLAPQSNLEQYATRYVFFIFISITTPPL